MSAIIMTRFPRFLLPLRGNVLSKARARQWRLQATGNESELEAIVQRPGRFMQLMCR